MDGVTDWPTLYECPCCKCVERKEADRWRPIQNFEP